MPPHRPYPGSRQADRSPVRRPNWRLHIAIISAALIVVATVAFSDDIISLLRGNPSPSALVGRWEFDADRAKDIIAELPKGSAPSLESLVTTFGRVTYTFSDATSDSISVAMDREGHAVIHATASIIEFPPNGFMLETATVGNRQELLFLLEGAGSKRCLIACVGTVLAPFKPSTVDP